MSHRFISSETGITPDVKLYLRMNGANNGAVFKDDSSTHWVVTPSNSQTKTAYYKFGGSSAYFGGNNTYYLYLPNSAESTFILGSNNFSIGAWVYPTANNSCVMACRRSAQADGWLQYIANTTGYLYFSCYIDSSWHDPLVGSGTTAVPLNQWSYVSTTRSGNTFTNYINGTSVGTATHSGAISTTDPTHIYPVIGCAAKQDSVAIEGSFTGYIDDVCVRIGSVVDGTKVPTRQLI